LQPDFAGRSNMKVRGHILVRPGDYPAATDGLCEQVEIAFDLIRVVLRIGDQRFGELITLIHRR